VLFLAALILVGESLGDRYGRRRIFGIEVAVFAIAVWFIAIRAALMYLVWLIEWMSVS
jgi:MFS family permease